MSDMFAELGQILAELEAAKTDYRETLIGLAENGASDEHIVAVAIRHEVMKYPKPIGPTFGAPPWGASFHSTAVAAVEALRICGRLRERAE